MPLELDDLGEERPAHDQPEGEGYPDHGRVEQERHDRRPGEAAEQRPEARQREPVGPPGGDRAAQVELAHRGGRRGLHDGEAGDGEQEAEDHGGPATKAFDSPTASASGARATTWKSTYWSSVITMLSGTNRTPMATNSARCARHMAHVAG